MVNLFYKVKERYREYIKKDKLNKIANVCIYFYYLLIPRRQSGIASNKDIVRNDEYIIISLTSFPSRINTLWLVTESLLRQTYKPQKIILWLAKEEFSNGKIPYRLLRQQKRGLEIHMVSNLRSYKKFYYAIKRYPQATIVTVDDDTFYSEYMLERLMEAHAKNPSAICCHRSRKIGIGSDGELLKYKKWKNSIDETRKMKERASFLTCPLGVGGVLIPHNTYDKAVLEKEIFMKLAPYADDIWLKWHAIIRGIPTVQLTNNYGDVIEVYKTQQYALSKLNDTGNDEQIKNLTEYYNIDWKNINSERITSSLDAKEN